MKAQEIDDRELYHLGRYVPACVYCVHLKGLLPDKPYCDAFGGRPPDRYWIKRERCPHFELQPQQRGGRGEK